MLEIHADGLPLDADVNLDELADATAGWPGAALELLCKKAAILALEECRAASSPNLRVAGRHLREAQSQMT